MSFWSKIENLISQSDVTEDTVTSGDGVALATAALLLEVAIADDKFTDVEHGCIVTVLKNHFDMDEAEAKQTIEQAKSEVDHATDLHSFTRILTDNFDQHGRQRIIRTVWQVILADGVVDNQEDNLIRKLCHLLGVSQYDSIRMRDDASDADDA